MGKALESVVANGSLGRSNVLVTTSPVLEVAKRLRLWTGKLM